MKFSQIISALFLASLFFVNINAQPLKGDWKLIEMKVDDKIVGLSDSNPPNLTFSEKDRFSGNAGCNSYSADYTVKNKTIGIKPGISTKMACLDNQRNIQERQFLGMFEKIAKYKLSGKTLIFTDGKNQNTLKFVRYNKIRPL